MNPDEAPALLTVDDLRISWPGSATDVVRGVSFQLRRGRVVGIVGESGSGKTLTCRAILGTLPDRFSISGGHVDLLGRDVTTLTPKDWRALRGSVIAAVFQDPASYLNPSIRVGKQVAEILRVKGGLSRRAAKARAIELFRDVALRNPELVYAQYPHQLSGGMLQRVLIASAVALNPQVLIADEVTTALDVTVQSAVLDLLNDLRLRIGLSLVVVSHDLAVVAQLCDEILVLRDGEVVEHGPTEQILFAPTHEYTKLLVGEHERYGLERYLAAADEPDGSDLDTLQAGAEETDRVS
ncbi:ABC transporter ATP-binding protein [Dactylosporangium sp. NPDC051484]|uniref:ABC transporter ATP-binding protein n=1 Tax=Dactylosporangium sp. NPDC051484 TaxID=3154942 RepID=UPI00344B2A4D